MDNSDTTAPKGEDIWVALGLLTRLPLPARNWDATRPAALAAWAYPVVGLLLGGLAGMVAWLLLALGLPPAMAAAALLLCLTMLTGAMHEDGLADAADGLWGGTTRQRRLEIMKDSHIGAYGTLALITGFALRWSALSALFSAGWLWAPVLVAAVSSRAVMACLMEALPNARDAGLSRLTGRPGKTAPRVAVGLAVLTMLLAFGLSGLWLLPVALSALLICYAIADRKIGGQTGDILGATQQVSEIMILAAVCALVL